MVSSLELKMSLIYASALDLCRTFGQTVVVSSLVMKMSSKDAASLYWCPTFEQSVVDSSLRVKISPSESKSHPEEQRPQLHQKSESKKSTGTFYYSADYLFSVLTSTFSFGLDRSIKKLKVKVKVK